MKNINTACAAIMAQTNTVKNNIIGTISQVITNTTNTVKTLVNPNKEDKKMKNVNIVKGFDTAVEVVVGQTHLIVDSVAIAVTDMTHMASDVTHKLVKKTRRFIKKQQSRNTKLDQHVDNVRKFYSDYLSDLCKEDEKLSDKLNKYYENNLVGSEETMNMYEKYFSKKLDLWTNYLRNAYDDMCGLDPEFRAEIVALVLFGTNETIDCYNGNNNISVTCDVIYRDYNVLVCANLGKNIIEVIGLDDEQWGRFRDLMMLRYKNMRISC